MTVGKVVGNVVCTPKHPALSGIKLMLVREIAGGREAGLVVAADSIRSAGNGNLVYMIDSTEAAASFRAGLVPVDLAIVGIVDSYNSNRYRVDNEN